MFVFADPTDFTWTDGTETGVVVPNVVGEAQADAEDAIEGVGLVPDVVTAYSPTVPEGDVISQSPTAGSVVEDGSTVTITISLGAAPVTVPDVVGLTQAAATSAITGAGLDASPSAAYDAVVPVGRVISQDPAATTPVAPGSTVEFVVSLGPAPTTVPNVVGMSQAAATTAIEGADLVAHAVGQYSGIVAVGTVISQDPVAGSHVVDGSTVNIFVSLGPAPPSTNRGSRLRHGYRINWKHT